MPIYHSIEFLHLKKYLEKRCFPISSLKSWKKRMSDATEWALDAMVGIVRDSTAGKKYRAVELPALNDTYISCWSFENNKDIVFGKKDIIIRSAIGKLKTLLRNSLVDAGWSVYEDEAILWDNEDIVRLMPVEYIPDKEIEIKNFRDNLYDDPSFLVESRGGIDLMFRIPKKWESQKELRALLDFTGAPKAINICDDAIYAAPIWDLNDFIDSVSIIEEKNGAASLAEIKEFFKRKGIRSEMYTN